MVQNKTLIYKKHPDGEPVPGKDLVVETKEFDLDAAPLEGGLTVKLLYSSFDPYMRGRMRDPSVKSYSPPFTIDKPIDSAAIGRVLKSDAEGFSEGDLVRGLMDNAEYVSLPKEKVNAPGITVGGLGLVRKLENPLNIDTSVFIGALGMPGLTAYSSLFDIGKPKKGETIFVSAAAGAVGQLVGQIAKSEGLKVIGSVGSKDKLDFIINDLGFDSGFNYKEEKADDALKRLAPEGIDIYYENVGGEQLDAALSHLNDFGRIVACGMISQYSKKGNELYGVKNISAVLTRRLTMRGFIVSDSNMGPVYAKEHLEKVSKWIADGSFKIKESYTEGIENAPEGFVGMLQGKNFGKAVLRYSDK